MNQDSLLTNYFQFTEIWKKFCELHNDLFFISLDEYSLLLSSDIDVLEQKLEDKKNIINQINNLDKERQACFVQIQNLAGNQVKLHNFHDVISYFKSNLDEEKNHKHLERFNSLLIDLIDKIKSQNKKTQIFINKAVHSLQTIREEAMGVKSSPIYNNKGMATKTMVT